MSAYTFPSRAIVSHTSNIYRTNGEISHDIDDNELQYLTPHTHNDLLDCVVKSYRSEFIEEFMDNSIALSLRCDGSVHRTQVDKMYVLIKSVNLKGEEKLYFIAETEIIKRGAEGICGAIKTACIKSVGNENFEVILRKISSLVTDGASSNIGEKNGLWVL